MSDEAVLLAEMGSHVCVMFDIDGTLCDTSSVDDECYRRAAAVSLAVPAGRIDWTEAPHRTDSGIAQWLWERWRSSPASADEVDDLRRYFVVCLKRERESSEHRFRAVAGAVEFVAQLRHRGVVVGIATGGWRASAELKLVAAGLPTALLYASADDAEARADIFTLGWRRATDRQSIRETVLIGDSVFDAATARTLGWGFLGVGTGRAEGELRQAGARCVIPDFVSLDWEAALQLAREPLGRVSPCGDA